MARLATALMIMVPVAAQAADAPALPALTLVVAKPVELMCRTKSVVVKTDAANATTGELKFSLVLKNEATKPPSGAWRIVSVADAHAGSLGHREAKVCAEACPLTVGADGNIELWSPAPKSITELKEGEMLLLAVVKSKTLDLRATTFSGKEIEALEEGSCRTGS
ncbi:MAG: hypothetical protein B7Z29_18535 [Hyphomicrobium sp. 12-62-95]|nr:MAG: hypothetical protein B7Z29_18535 [Hyphomicrobium sp. 12-62-95]